MGKLSNITESFAFKRFLAAAYGAGAAIVIMGALFKILHWPGADLMLIIGMGTESIIFLMSAFEPVKEEPDWSLVYPELAGMDAKEKQGIKKHDSPSQELDKMLEEAKIEPELLEKLGENFRHLNDNVSKMGSFSDASVATDEYAENVKKASENVHKINESYANALEAVNSLSESSGVSREYYEQLQTVTQKLASLNSMYELELQESDNYVKQLSSFQGRLSKTMDNLADTEEESASFKNEFSRLNENISNLNQIYGNMLSAMGGQLKRGE